ncbi:MAG: hypothetical protein MJZ90_09165 [Bacteroidales bacterium]|nr:hypothetical protein [Bacteroidales bacterium]
MIQYPTYCSIAETNDSIAGSIVAVETHGRASLQLEMAVRLYNAEMVVRLYNAEMVVRLYNMTTTPTIQ